jgi:hypothetical protein
MLALGAFRIGTLCKLCYRHVRHDIERGVVPVHVHVEADITKGKYHDYDTFIGGEAVEYLKAYLEARRNGGLPNKIPREDLNDESPLIRDEHSKALKPLTPSQVYNILHGLMAQAGLLGSKVGRRYTVRPHSIRKFFRTQMAALGVQTDYIEYMMGHTISTYHDIQMKGIEFLRGIYTASGLGIKPKNKTQQNRNTEGDGESTRPKPGGDPHEGGFNNALQNSDKSGHRIRPGPEPNQNTGKRL